MATTVEEQCRLVDFMETVKLYEGRWYIWGGDDPLGFDCSGLVIEGLKAAGEVANDDDFTADGLWNKYKHLQVDKARRGSLAFWFDKRGHAVHVAVCLSEFSYIGAEGGGRHVNTMEDAMKANAFIKRRPLRSRPGATIVHIWK